MGNSGGATFDRYVATTVRLVWLGKRKLMSGFIEFVVTPLPVWFFFVAMMLTGGQLNRLERKLEVLLHERD